MKIGLIRLKLKRDQQTNINYRAVIVVIEM